MIVPPESVRVRAVSPKRRWEGDGEGFRQETYGKAGLFSENLLRPRGWQQHNGGRLSAQLAIDCGVFQSKAGIFGGIETCRRFGGNRRL
jgi:hypothetical protein